MKKGVGHTGDDLRRWQTPESRQEVRGNETARRPACHTALAAPGGGFALATFQARIPRFRACPPISPRNGAPRGLQCRASQAGGGMGAAGWPRPSRTALPHVARRPRSVVTYARQPHVGPVFAAAKKVGSGPMHVSLAHDDGCPLLHGTDPCGFGPEVTTRREDDQE